MTDPEFAAVMARIAGVMEEKRMGPVDEALYLAFRGALRVEFDAAVATLTADNSKARDVLLRKLEDAAADVAGARADLAAMTADRDAALTQRDAAISGRGKLLDDAYAEMGALRIEIVRLHEENAAIAAKQDALIAERDNKQSMLDVFVKAVEMVTGEVNPCAADLLDAVDKLRRDLDAARSERDASNLKREEQWKDLQAANVRADKAEAECVVWRREADAAAHAGLRAQERADKAEAGMAAMREARNGYEARLVALWGDNGTAEAIGEVYAEAFGAWTFHVNCETVRALLVERDRLREQAAKDRLVTTAAETEIARLRDENAAIRVHYEQVLTQANVECADASAKGATLTAELNTWKGREEMSAGLYAAAEKARMEQWKELQTARAALGRAHAAIGRWNAGDDAACDIDGALVECWLDPTGRAAAEYVKRLEEEIVGHREECCEYPHPVGVRCTLCDACDAIAMGGGK